MMAAWMGRPALALSNSPGAALVDPQSMPGRTAGAVANAQREMDKRANDARDRGDRLWILKPEQEMMIGSRLHRRAVAWLLLLALAFFRAYGQQQARKVLNADGWEIPGQEVG